MAQRADDCSICLQSLKHNQEVSHLASCCHKFHKHCIKQWLRITKHPTCPICRELTSIAMTDDTEWLPQNYQNTKTNKKVKKSQRIARRLKWKTRQYIFECSQCQKSFKDKDALFNHEKKHNKARKEHYNYKCGHCDYSDLFKNTFEAHNISEHNESKPFQCRRCKMKFKLSPNLNNHIRFIHWKIRNHKCVTCDATFYDKHHLTKHSRTHSSNKTPFKCKLCGRGFNQKSDLTRHQTVHSSEKPFQCNICGKRYKFKRDLRRHQIKKLHKSLNYNL